MQEAIAFGQRVESWIVAADQDGRFVTAATGTTIGRKRIAPFTPLQTRRIRISIAKARACPVLSTVSVYAR
jgi:alpha-L-fucosidase